MTVITIKAYRFLAQLPTFEERFRYLALGGTVGEATFGFDRYINQRFYTSREWKNLRDFVIVRDNGCDLGVDGYEIHGQILVHHMNPIGAHDISDANDNVFNPECLITTTKKTHNAIHYGDERLLPKPFRPRERGDTRLW